MAFLTQSELEALNFKHLGKNVKISDKAALYNTELMSIDDNSRIDDFCVVSGKVSIGKHVHIAVFCNVVGGEPGITFHDFSGLAYGCHVFAQSDDYSGKSMTNPTVPACYKKEVKRPVSVGRHSIIGASSLILPGIDIAEGTSVGAMSMVTKSTDSWSIYFGSPARRLKSRSKELLSLEKDFLSGTSC